MIDVHNHILSGVDDGPASHAESLAMARQAVSQGTTVMVATPHRFHGRCEQTSEVVVAEVAKLQASLDSSGIALRIVPGVEATMRPDTPEMFRTGKLLPLGGPAGSHVLIEPPFDRVPPHAIPLLAEIVKLGLVPVIAHPERNADVQNHLAFLETCVGLGSVIQLTAGSIIGKFGSKPRECAQRIAARRDWTILIASDAHDALDRTPGDMLEAVEVLAHWIGDRLEASRMADEIPRGVLNGR